MLLNENSDNCQARHRTPKYGTLQIHNFKKYVVEDISALRSQYYLELSEP
jgi:hypothetical protein